MSERVGLLGDGGQARETRWVCSRIGIEVIFSALSRDYINQDNELYAIDIEEPAEEQLSIPVIASVGSPFVKKEMIDTWKGAEYATIIDESVLIGDRSEIGEGTYIAPGSIITTDVLIGKHVLINTGVTISHNTVIGDYSTVSPGVKVAGGVICGKGVFLGIGATIMNGVSIAEGAVVGAGAVVTHDITEANAVFVGVPARRVNQNTTWLKKI